MPTRSWKDRAAAQALILVILAALQAHAATDQVFTVTERFGVSHPDQIIDFDFSRSAEFEPTNSYLVGPGGAEVPYQSIEGGARVAVRTSLAAGSELTWTLKSGRSPSNFPGGISVQTTATYLEITNGVTGVRITLATNQLAQPLAPIHGLLYRDGTWTATNACYVQIQSNSTWIPLPATNITVRFVERGPLKAVVEAFYRAARPAFQYGPQVNIPAGPGYFRSLITLEAGQPSVLVEDETDMDLRYALNVVEGLNHPDEARYQAHHASSVTNGHSADGTLYTDLATRGSNSDAFVSIPFPSSGPYGMGLFVTRWDPWTYDTGWYWEMYRRGAAGTNVFGIFQGLPSRTIGGKYAGAEVYSASADDVGVRFKCFRRSPDASVFLTNRVSWGIFIGTTNDLAESHQPQNICRQMSLHGGFNLNKVRRYVLDYPDPTNGWQGIYTDRSVVTNMIARLRADTGGPYGSGYYGHLYNAESSGRDLWDAWADASGAKARTLCTLVTNTAADMLDEFVNGQGIYDLPYDYWMGGSIMNQQAVYIDALLVLDDMDDAVLTAEQRQSLKAAAALYSYFLWDNDFVPLFDGHGLNLGTANMPVMQLGYRDLYVLMLSLHPAMALQTSGVRDRTLATLGWILNPYGAEMGSAHYLGASWAPTANTLQQLKVNAGYDGFAAEDRVARFGEFYMNLMTPPEVRFGGVRKIVAIGDGSTEGIYTFQAAQLATAFADVDPLLSERLMGAWRSAGSLHSAFDGSSVLKIDEALPSRDPGLGSATFPGWCSVLRDGWGTGRETAMWVVNGDTYSDHRHYDWGTVVMYALGAPLSLDWGPIYYPRVAYGYMHSMVLPAYNIACAWDQDSPPLDAGGAAWNTSTQERFHAFPTHSEALSRFYGGNNTNLTWRRAMALIHANTNYPAIVLRDTFEGPNSASNKVFSLNLMADGAVQTPGGVVTPTVRTYDYYNTNLWQLPSAGTTFSVTNGLNRFAFSGQWLIDWDLYLVATNETQQAFIGNWANTWNNSVEVGQFAAAQGRSYEERQHILRVRGAGPFTALLLPHRKGEARTNQTVALWGPRIVVRAERETTVVASNGYWFCRGLTNRTVVASLDGAAAQAFDLRVAGGAAVIERDSSGTTARLDALTPDAFTNRYAWTQLSGPETVALAGAASAQASASLGTPGTYVFRVVDSGSIVRTNDVTVTLGATPLDGDADGLPDDWEMHFLGTVAANGGADPDGDGLTNAAEWACGLNPGSADSDDDGMPDGWELAQGLNPANGADGSGDADGDGLSNAQEYAFAANPHNPDTDGDGISDGDEVRYGSSPTSYEAHSPLPFTECFEAETVGPGFIHGQNNWRAAPADAAQVQSAVAYDGSRALEFGGWTGGVSAVQHLFAPGTGRVVWVDAMMQVRPSWSTAEPSGESAAAFFDAEGRLVVCDGSKPSGSRWITLTNHVPLAAGAWARLTVKLDYAAQRWTVYLDGSRVAAKLGFATANEAFTALEVEAERTVVDGVRVDQSAPPGIIDLDLPAPRGTILRVTRRGQIERDGWPL